MPPIDPNPLARRRERVDPWKWAVVFFFFALSFALFYQLCQRPASDISIHATWAAEGDFRDPTSFLHHGAHPLWHGLVALLLLTGMPLDVAAALITALCKAAELWLIHRLFSLYLEERLGPARIALLSGVCAMVSCLCVPFYNPTVYLGVGSPNTWHSCTQMIAMVFMLLCVPYTAHCYDAFTRLLPTQKERALLPWRKPVALGVLLLLSLLAKPTFMQAFLPAACLFFLYQWIRHPKNSRFFGQIILCVLPAVVFMLVQYMYYFGIIVPSQGDMVLELSIGKLCRVALSTLLIQAFPLYVLWAYRKAGERDTFFWLTLVFDAVGVIEFLILGENGRRAADGNFGWGMMGAALMMWVVAIIRFFRAQSGGKSAHARPDARRAAGFALLGWHLLSGAYYVVYLFTTQNVL
ncbi:MAG: hypothetical protein MR842_10320 [Clostridiales bacterium]|nr:hypothetical protein [Clostridiales bacterium]MDO4350277.1 hypothetical protein [Eubacteriales bacterium]MDY4007611.1 hypothetical protein [Candidatus Limiplasma sp.]